MPSFGFILYMVSEKKIFKHFYENRPFLPPLQPIKYTDLDKSHMKRRGLLNKHFCKTNSQISPLRQKKIANFHFSHKSMGTISCHSNQSSYPTGIKNITFHSPLPKDAMRVIWKESASRFQEMSFENVDGRTTDGRRMPVYTISSPMSLRLR